MQRHTQSHHKHDTNAPKYTMTVKQIYGDNNCMDRQIAEGIHINKVPNKDCINNKQVDYKQNKIPRAVFSWE